MEPLLTIIISTYDEGILELKKAIKIENPSIKYLIVFQNPKHIRIPDFLNRKDIDIIDSKTKGLSVSRNIGIENCKTPYALLSDDDVEYIEEGLDQVLEIIQKEKIDFATFKIKTYDGEPEYNDYSSEKEEIKNIQHYISSIEILVNLQTLKLKKIKFDERFGLGTFLMRGEEEILIHDLQKKNSIGFYFPIYIVKRPFLSTGKIKLKEWKNYFIKGAFHQRIEKTNYTLPPTNKLRDLKNSFFYILGKIYIKYTK